MAEIKGRKQNHRVSGKLRAHRETLRVSALARKEAHDKLTPQQKLEKLDAKFGVGLGAARERARLAKLLQPKE